MKAVYLGLLATLLTGTATLAADPHGTPGTLAHWEYTGEAGPDKWGSFSPDYHVCSAGQMQSPI